MKCSLCSHKVKRTSCFFMRFDRTSLAKRLHFSCTEGVLKPTTLSVRNIVALLAWGARNAPCFFLLRAPLHLPQAARCSEPVNSRCGCVWQGRRFGSASKVKKSRKTGVSLLFLAPPCWTRTNDPAVNSGCDANIKQCHLIPCSVEP